MLSRGTSIRFARAASAGAAIALVLSAAGGPGALTLTAFAAKAPARAAAAPNALNPWVLNKRANTIANPPKRASTAEPSPITSITTSPLTLSPAFSTSTHDYVLPCAAGVNTISFIVTTATSTDTFFRDLVESQAEELSDPSGAQYWIRCLPHDFPQVATTRGTAAPSPGYYATSNITTTPGTSPYAMILDTNGVPVWYAPTPGGAANVQILPNNTVNWIPPTGLGIGVDPAGAAWNYSLATRKVQLFRPPIGPADPHEFLSLSNGNWLMVATPLVAGVPDLPPSMASDPTKTPDPNPNNNLVDCVIEEFKPNGDPVWSWNAHAHVSPTENVIPNIPSYNGQPAADAYHCNSIDIDPTATNPSTADLLVSMRHTSAVFRINRSVPASGPDVTWKLGGTLSTKEQPKGAKILAISDPSNLGPRAQHDARFQPGGDVSIYDDQSFSNNAARAIQYHVDAVAGTATLDLSLPALDGKPAAATGGFRRYGAADNVIGWGFKSGFSMSEVDNNNNHLLDFTFLPTGNNSYRFIKYGLGAISLDLMRATAGLAPQPPNAGSVVLDGWGGLHQFDPAATPVNTAGSAYWYGWDIARGVAVRPDGSGGYTLDGWGSVHGFGAAADPATTAGWPGWDIARAIALCGNGSSGYVLDGWGGIHSFGGAPPIDDGSHAYWYGWDIARSIAVKSDCSGGYTLDGWGGVHRFGNAPEIVDVAHAYFSGQDIARSIVLRPDGVTGYALDGNGNIHAFGGMPDPTPSATWPGWDIARSLVLAGDARSGYVVDGWGGVHNFGNTVPFADVSHAYWPDWDIARSAG